VRKAKDEADFWWHLYFNEAVPTTERLHKELAALKAEKGEKHFIEPNPPQNPEVLERKLFPLQFGYGLEGVPEELIPSAVHDTDYTVLLPATWNSVKTLRPQGWKPCMMAGEVWIKRMVELLSEEDAARRIEGREQTAQGNGASMSTAGSGHSSMSITYASKDVPISDAVGFDNELPVVLGCVAQASSSLSKIPGPARTSSERAYSSTVLAIDDQAHRSLTASPPPSPPTQGSQLRPTTQRSVNVLSARRVPNQAPKPKPNLQAARRAAPTPIQEEPRAPSYRPSWLKKNKRLTREAYEEMDSLEKIDTLSMLEELC
jgi:hypothetical protein